MPSGPAGSYPSMPFGWIGPQSLLSTALAYGPQYGANQALGLEDLGMEGLSLLDQFVLAGYGQQMFPDDPMANQNWITWLDAMQTMNPELLVGTPWAVQTAPPPPPAPAPPTSNPVTDPAYPLEIGGINTGAGYAGNPASLQTSTFAPPARPGSVSNLFGNIGTIGQGFDLIQDQARQRAREMGLPVPETKPDWRGPVKSPLAEYLTNLDEMRRNVPRRRM